MVFVAALGLVSRLACNEIATSSMAWLNEASDDMEHRYYRACQRAADDPTAFRNFKRDPDYTAILEHLKFDYGKKYVAHIRATAPWMLAPPLLAAYRQNDEAGHAQTFEFEGIGRFSPTTIRYVAVAAELFAAFGDMTGWRVAEIGGGYGGQAKVLMDVAHISHYAIWDVPQANALQSQYLKKHFGKTNVSFHSSFNEDNSVAVGDTVEADWNREGIWFPGKVTDTYNGLYRILYDDGESESGVEKARVRLKGKPRGAFHPSDALFDLVISNYAVSELAEEAQLVYADKLISKAKHAFLTINGGVIGKYFCNTPHKGCPGLSDYSSKLKALLIQRGHRLSTRPEIPFTNNLNEVVVMNGRPPTILGQALGT